MIVTCPACSANYRIKTELIDPQKGRVVRCSACGNNWRIFPKNINSKHTNQDPPKALPKPNKINTQQDKKASPPKSTTRITTEPAEKNTSLVMWLIAILSFNVLLFGLGYLFRKDIVATFPQTERLYQIIGIDDVTVTGISLVMPYLEKVNHDDGRVSLVVQGSFLNSHPQDTLKIPPLKIILLNSENRPIANFTKNDFKPDTLLAGGHYDFTYEIPNLPKDAVDVRIEFEK